MRTYRERKNITLKDLSKLVNLTPSYLSKIENNKREPSLRTLKRISRVLDVCFIRLIGGCYNTFCGEGCIYYKDRYDMYNKLPKEGQEEFDKLNSYMINKYKDYLF
jgi:transcriptional regulator with XRE-family HTH domain